MRLSIADGNCGKNIIESCPLPLPGNDPVTGTMVLLPRVFLIGEM